MPSLEPTSQLNYVSPQQLHHQLQQSQINSNTSGILSARMRDHSFQLNSPQLHRPENPGNRLNFNGNQFQRGAEYQPSPHHISQPCLVNLDRRTGKIPLFQYPLPMGITMLGTGRGCVKPPDILLHGQTVAPQHCFIERREDEVTLHPISELTIVEDSLIAEPTKLVPGNVISIGESHVFRFEGLQASTYQTPSQILYEFPCPVNGAGAGNPSRTAGDVNKNSFRTMEIMDASQTQSVGAVGHHHEEASPSPILKTSNNVSGEESAKKYRDGFESDNFVSKVARFEYLAHTQRPPPFPTANSVFPTTNLTNGKQSSSFELDCNGQDPSHHYNQSRTSTHTNGNNHSADNDNNHMPEQTNGFSNKSDYGYTSNTTTSRQHQQPLYNNYSQSYCSPEEYNNNLLCSPNNSSERNPVSYKGAYSDSSASTTASAYGYGYAFSPTTPTPSYASASNTEFEHDEHSSPSPDSFRYNHHNNHYQHIQPTYYSKQINVSPATTTNGTISRNSVNGGSPYNNSAPYYENTMEDAIACETLLEMKRKQAQEARQAAQATENSDKLRLEEILEMCAEYEQQIARELEERRQDSSSSNSTSLSLNKADSYTPSSANHSNGQGLSQDVRSPSSISTSVSGDGKSPGTPTSHYYSRIKTNGSLPREKKNSIPDARRPPPGSNNVITDEEIASIFTFDISDTSSSSSNYYSNSLTNGNGYGRISSRDDDVFSPKTPGTVSTTLPNTLEVNSPSLSTTDTLSELRSNKSPYENIVNTNQNGKYVQIAPQPSQSQLPRIKTTATTSSSPTSFCPNDNNSFSNGKTALEVKETNYPRRTIITTVLEPAVHSSCLSSSSSTSSTTSSSSFHNNSNSYISGLQNNDNGNVSRRASNNSSNSSNSVCSNVDKIERCETPPKSKLSVSFAKSVEEYHEIRNNVDDDEEGFVENDLPLRNVNTENNGSRNGSRNGKESYPRPIVKTIATEVQVHVEDCSNNNSNSNSDNSNCNLESSSVSPSHSNSSESERIDNRSFSTETNGTDNGRSSSSSGPTEHSSSPHHQCVGDVRIAHLKKEISEVEQQEMEALREMEIEKALLVGEEKSLQAQLQTDKTELEELKDRLRQIDESHRRWKMDSLERIGELRGKLIYSEKELQRLEKMHEAFCGSTDEETVLLERLKFQHELVESDRKAFEDAEFHHMEHEVNREAQRDELTKTLAESSRKLLTDEHQLEQLKSQNRISFSSSAKEIGKLEKNRQYLIREMHNLRESVRPTSDTLSIPETNIDNLSDSEDMKNSDLEEKLRALAKANASAEDAMHIERIKSRSPIDPTLGCTMGAKTCETLRKIERNREFLLNEQGVQMLEEERQRVRELQKRVQDAVREEWEASRKSRSNQCQSLNSVGSDDSTQTISDTPTTDSGCSDDATTDKSGAPSLSTTDVSLNGTGNGLCGIDMAMEMAIGGALGQNSFELCQQMRQKQRDMSQSFEETRPLSDGSAYDNGSSIVTMRDKHRVQNRPLTRYLPVRGDEDDFDLRAHIESSGHQLELCPHVIVTTATARGFLSKLGSRFHNWNKRWFVFDRETRTFSYYSDKNEKKPRGGIHFQAIEEVYVDHLQSVKSPIPKLTFCVKTYNRVFHLLAPSAEAMRIWIDIIFTGAEGYQEFKCGP